MQLRTCGVGRRFRLSTGVDMQGSFLARRRAVEPPKSQSR